MIRVWAYSNPNLTFAFLNRFVFSNTISPFKLTFWCSSVVASAILLNQM